MPGEVWIGGAGLAGQVAKGADWLGQVRLGLAWQAFKWR